MIVEWSEKARKQLKKIDNSIKNRIFDYMDSIALLDNPRSKGKALIGNFKGYWRYRVGDYRLLCKIKDDKLIIFVVEVGHRRCVYDE